MPDARKPPSESGGLFANNCPAAGLDKEMRKVSMQSMTGGHLRMHQFGDSRHSVVQLEGSVLRENLGGNSENDFAQSDFENRGESTDGRKKRRAPTNAPSSSSKSRSTNPQNSEKPVAQNSNGYDEGCGPMGSQELREFKLDSKTDLGRGSKMVSDERRAEGSQATRSSLEFNDEPTNEGKSSNSSSEKRIFRDGVQGSGIPELAMEEVIQVCSRCGHEADSILCCQAQTHSKRAGERQRQEAKRAKKVQALKEETASRRPREILSVEEASTPAQITMAKMRARLRKGTTE